ncbi:hypothetical protein T11_14222 [Trichinella zimbabwensis]|uniref:Uncharacterized protein n=1 Tax=Trichinella zimbabwensis TaxID=268475 RepID=A0A0V1I3A9_9BILA|nr:hypothetical protein T11_14222 [Trichinella zimbabwensis]
MNRSLASLNGCLPRSIHFKLTKANAPASQRPSGLIFFFQLKLSLDQLEKGKINCSTLKSQMIKQFAGQIFLTLVRRIWALILLAVCLEKAGCPLRVSCGKRKKPANLAPSARDDDWISEIESID